MEQQSQRVFLKAKIKCGVFKQLFNQIVKNIKNHKTFFMHTCKQGIQMIFMESDKEVEIKAFLSNKIFVPYDWDAELPTTYSFDIKDLELIGDIFQNTATLLTLYFRESSLEVCYQNQFSGHMNYIINTLVVEEADIPQEVGRFELLDEEIKEKCTRVRVSKAKLLANELHTLGLFKKYEEVEIKFQTNYSRISLMPVPINTHTHELTDSDSTYRIDVKYERNVQHQHPIRFFIRKLKAGLALFDKNSELYFTFYSNCVKIETYSKDIRDKKNIVIMIACAAQ